jgi:hypothetical protein
MTPYSSSPQLPALLRDWRKEEGYRNTTIATTLYIQYWSSNKGWRPAKESDHRKGDERIQGVDFAIVNEYVARLFNLSPEEILLPGKYRNRVAARSVLCYFLVRELGMTATTVANKLGIGQPAVSIAVARGEIIVREKGLDLSRRQGK